MSRFPALIKWCFTQDVPEFDDGSITLGLIWTWVNSGNFEYCFQLEEGENGYRHVQGCIKSDKKFRPNELFQTTSTHWEGCKSWDAQLLYCSKSESRVAGPWTNVLVPLRLTDPLEGLELYPWQKEIEELYKTLPDRRTVHWYWESVGNVGKTTFATHMCMKGDVLYLSGKAADIKYAISNMKSKKKNFRMVIFDFTRCTEEFISYEAIESVKNGIFFSGKYESDMCLFPPPHVVCFANFHPNESKLSSDRWHIVNI